MTHRAESEQAYSRSIRSSRCRRNSGERSRSGATGASRAPGAERLIAVPRPRTPRAPGAQRLTTVPRGEGASFGSCSALTTSATQTSNINSCALVSSGATISAAGSSTVSATVSGGVLGTATQSSIVNLAGNAVNNRDQDINRCVLGCASNPPTVPVSYTNTFCSQQETGRRGCRDHARARRAPCVKPKIEKERVLQASYVSAAKAVPEEGQGQGCFVPGTRSGPDVGMRSEAGQDDQQEMYS